MRFELGRWTIECDPAVTASCYALLPRGSGCDCLSCRNFMAALDVAFSDDFCEMARRLGVDVAKPAELAHYYKLESGLYLTGGWFHVVGRILGGADLMQPNGPNRWRHVLERMPSGLEFGFGYQAMCVADAFKMRPLVQLEFSTRVEWVLGEGELE